VATHEKYRYYSRANNLSCGVSADADYRALKRAETAWCKQQQETAISGRSALAAKAPISNVREILTRAHQKKVKEQRALKQRLTEHLKR
jgi:hypothetical protein